MTLQERLRLNHPVRHKAADRIDALEAMLRDATEKLESGLETEADLEHEWSIADREFCKRARALLGE